jgi:hypothetical protein
MKPGTDRKNGKKLLELRAKALRRGEKLANTLRKLIAKGDPADAPSGSLLKELEKALAGFRQPSGQQDSPVTVPRTRRSERTSGKAGQGASASASPTRRNDRRQPASPAAE